MPSAGRGLDAGEPRLLIVGHGRIAEAMARLGVMLEWQVTVNSPGAAPEAFPDAARIITDDLDFKRLEVTPDTNVVVATQHKGDPLSIKAAAQDNAGYIGLIASRKRASLVLDYLAEEGVAKHEIGRLHAPAGLDLGAVNPEEIALSVISEMIALRNGGSGRPMHTRKPLGEVGGEAGGVDGCKGLFD